MAWKGPDISEVLERKALDILGTYLTSSATAPLMKEFVEIENPLWLDPVIIHSLNVFLTLSSSAPTSTSQKKRVSNMSSSRFTSVQYQHHISIPSTRNCSLPSLG